MILHNKFSLNWSPDKFQQAWDPLGISAGIANNRMKTTTIKYLSSHELNSFWNWKINELDDLTRYFVIGRKNEAFGPRFLFFFFMGQMTTCIHGNAVMAFSQLLAVKVLQTYKKLWSVSVNNSTRRTRGSAQHLWNDLDLHMSMAIIACHALEHLAYDSCIQLML